jgi:CheY-like chemotaxis protein
LVDENNHLFLGGEANITLQKSKLISTTTTIQHIFYVDDDDDDLEIFRVSLEELYPGVRLTTISHGELLFPVLEANDIPDIILLDINMPQVDGLEFLQMIRSNILLSHIPVVIYSTSKFDKLVQQAANLGANYFVQKGNSLNELNTFIKDLYTMNLGQPLTRSSLQ